tara:strand:- start:135 stop:317 length:183 start_codon:yes stop_codon:yes gene_type:complete
LIKKKRKEEKRRLLAEDEIFILEGRNCGDIRQSRVQVPKIGGLDLYRVPLFFYSRKLKEW